MDFNKSANITTVLGGLLTILTIILVLVASWLIGSDIFYKRKPFSYTQTTTRNSFQAVNLNKSSLPIAFSIANAVSNIPIDETYLHVKISYFTLGLDDTGYKQVQSQVKLRYQPCTYDDFPNFDQNVLDGFGIKTYYCLNSNDYNLNLYGYWTEDKLSYLSFEVFKCNNRTDPDFCKSEREINEYIAQNTINFDLIIPDYNIDLSNFKTPANRFLTMPYFFLTNDIKIVNFFVETDTVNTDKGWLFEDDEKLTYNKAVMKMADTGLYDDVAKELIVVDIYASNQSSTAQRSYIKIPEISASVGGLIKLVTIVLSFLAKPFIEIKKNITAIEAFFDKINIHENNVSNVNFSNIALKNQLRFKSSNLSLGENSEVLRKFARDKVNAPSEGKLNVPLKCRENLQVVCRALCRRKALTTNKNINTYEKGSSKLSSYFDLLQIILKLKKFELMEQIVFSKEQLKLMSMVKSSLKINAVDFEEDFNKIEENSKSLHTYLNKVQVFSDYDMKILNLILD